MRAKRLCGTGVRLVASQRPANDTEARRTVRQHRRHRAEALAGEDFRRPPNHGGVLRRCRRDLLRRRSRHGAPLCNHGPMHLERCGRSSPEEERHRVRREHAERHTPPLGFLRRVLLCSGRRPPPPPQWDGKRQVAPNWSGSSISGLVRSNSRFACRTTGARAHLEGRYLRQCRASHTSTETSTTSTHCR